MAINHCFYVIKHLTKLVVGFHTMTWNFMEFKIKEQLPPYVFEVNMFQSCILTLWKFDWENKRGGQKCSFLFAVSVKWWGKHFVLNSWDVPAVVHQLPCASSSELDLKTWAMTELLSLAHISQPVLHSMHAKLWEFGFCNSQWNPGISICNSRFEWVQSTAPEWLLILFSLKLVKFRGTWHTSGMWDSLPSCSWSPSGEEWMLWWACPEC